MDGFWADVTGTTFVIAAGICSLTIAHETDQELRSFRIC